MLCIFTNSLALAAYDYSDRKVETQRNMVLEQLGSFFTIVFTIEFLLKVVAMGFYKHKNSYLKDGWNRIDFVVVMTGVLEILPGSLNLKALRTVRVLRPLRSINAIPRMKRLVATLIKSLPEFLNVAAFLFFFFLLFSIMGLNTAQGALYNRCRLTEKPTNATYWQIDNSQTRLCSLHGLGSYSCKKDTKCGNPIQYGVTMEKEDIKNNSMINYGLASFDNLPMSFLLVFQVLTQDSWTTHLYNYMDSEIAIQQGLFFCFIILLGPFFLLNLILAVILTQFQSLHTDDSQQLEQFASSLAGINSKKFEEIKEENSVDERSSMNLDNSAQKLKVEEEKEKKFSIVPKIVSSGKHVDGKRVSEALQKKLMNTLKLEVPQNQLAGIMRSKADQNPVQKSENLMDVTHKIKLERPGGVRGYLFDFSTHQYFSAFIIFCIVFNTFCLALDRYPISQEEFSVLELFNTVLSGIFLLEMVLKICGLGLSQYFRDKFNTFDCFIVFSSVIDFFLSLVFASNGDSGGGAISALRAFRLLRVFKLAKSWKKLQQLLKTIAATLNDISIFSILLLLFMFTFSLLGMDLFGHKAKFNSENEVDLVNGESPKANFDYFLEAFCSVFIVLANDGWSTIYFDYGRTKGLPVPACYFWSLLIIGQFILLNLFLAILLQNFDEGSANLENMKKKYEEELKMKREIGQISKFQIFKENFIDSFKKCLGLKRKKRFELKSPSVIANKDKAKHLAGKMLNRMKKKDPMESSQKIEIQAGQVLMTGKSLQLFSIDSKFRSMCYKLCYDNNWFEASIAFCILVSSVQLAIETPLLDPEGELLKALWIIDMITTLVFTFEAATKIVSFGFLFNGEDSYLLDGWNIMDFSIVVMSILGLFDLSSSMQIIKLFRILKVFRPLRFIARNQGLKIAVFSLIHAIPSVFSIVIISGLFFLIFGIIAVSYFKGRFYYCLQSELGFEVINEVKNKWECLDNGGDWRYRIAKFDNIAQSMSALFVMGNAVGWAEIMYNGMATRQIDEVPIEKNNIYMSLFFIFFIIFGSFFIMNLFIGIVISNFNREKERLGKNFLLTDKQREWLEIRLIMHKSQPKSRPKKPKNKIRVYFYDLINNSNFEPIILATIILNTFVLMVTWYDEPFSISLLTLALNFLFAFVFTMEAVMKITALGKNYFKDGWNKFDFSIVIGTIFGIVFNYMSSVNVGTSTSIIRSFRIFRVLRLVKKAKALRLMFTTFIVTLPALINVGGLLFLLLYLFSILGMNLFGTVKVAEPINDHANFQTFVNSFITLIRVATGENWHYILWAMERDKSVDFFCIPSPTYQDYIENGSKTVGCGIFSAKVFFFFYTLVVKLIFLNLFIAIILQGFEDTNQREQSNFNNDVNDGFKEKWADFDPHASSFIEKEQFVDFLYHLGPPLGLKEEEISRKQKQKQQDFVERLKLKQYNFLKSYGYADVLQKLTLNMMVKEQIKEMSEEQLSPHSARGLAKKAGTEDIRKQLQEDLDNIMDGGDNIEAVQKLKEIENKGAGATHTISHEQIEAAKKIVRIYRERKAAQKKKQQQQYEVEEKSEFKLEIEQSSSSEVEEQRVDKELREAEEQREKDLQGGSKTHSKTQDIKKKKRLDDSAPQVKKTETQIENLFKEDQKSEVTRDHQPFFDKSSQKPVYDELDPIKYTNSPTLTEKKSKGSELFREPSGLPSSALQNQASKLQIVKEEEEEEKDEKEDQSSQRPLNPRSPKPSKTINLKQVRRKKRLKITLNSLVTKKFDLQQQKSSDNEESKLSQNFFDEYLKNQQEKQEYEFLKQMLDDIAKKDLKTSEEISLDQKYKNYKNEISDLMRQ